MGIEELVGPSRDWWTVWPKMLEIWELITRRKQHKIGKDGVEETSCRSQDPTRVVAQLMMMMMMIVSVSVTIHTSLDTQLSGLLTKAMGDESCVTDCASAGYKQASKQASMQTHTNKQMQTNRLTAFTCSVSIP
jgi:hypothetical protein